ncbi:RHS repeat-associated core domain-containing protein [Sphingobacterium thalpophilum]|uniref:RHS repeat-associated core domain-containing protein n=1 Tax=Sphingobacterium thalpophilum TaxID=259 RepID=UPI003DA5BB47
MYHADYYPYGMEVRSGGIDSRYGYQGLYAEKDKETGWNSFELRNYDPAVGRWLTVDPMAQYVSPYVGMGNNPVSLFDPTGGWSGGGLWGWFKGIFASEKKDVAAHYKLEEVKISRFYNKSPVLSPGQNISAAERRRRESLYYLRQNLANPDFNDMSRASTSFAVVAGAGEAIAGELAAFKFGQLYRYIWSLPRSSTVAKAVSAEGAVWAQKTFSGTFSVGGKFAGQTVDDVAGMLRSGTLSAADVPINVVVRNGQTFILNTRSSAALIKAGIPRSSWNVINQTGVSSFESMLTDQLGRNSLIYGTNTIRQSGTQLILSH